MLELGQIMATLHRLARQGNLQAIKLLPEASGGPSIAYLTQDFDDDAYTGYLDLDEDISHTANEAYSILSKEDMNDLRTAVDKISNRYQSKKTTKIFLGIIILLTASTLFLFCYMTMIMSCF